MWLSIRKTLIKNYLAVLALLVGLLAGTLAWALLANQQPPENQPPVLSPIGDKVVGEGFRLEIDVEAVDPDGDQLAWQVENLPAGASFGGVPPVLVWTLPAAGTYEGIVVTVSDGRLVDSKSFSIEVKVMPDTLQPPLPSMIPLNLVYYGPHNTAIDDLIIGANPEYVIANTSHGLWGEITGTDIFPNMDRYLATGIKVIGYLTAGYEGTGSAGAIPSQWYTLEYNLSLIKNMAEIDKVNGIFIDECSSFPDAAAREYLQALTKLAHSYGLITWGNTGVADFDSWYFTDGGFDLVHSNENWSGQSLSPVQRDWGYRISVTGNHSDLTVQEAYEITADALAKGLAYCYITPGYQSLPVWFEQYIALLKSHGKSMLDR